MKINQIKGIEDSEGDWIILVDYGTEGIRVVSQHKTAEGAIKNLGDCGGSPQTIVKLPDFYFTCSDD